MDREDRRILVFGEGLFENRKLFFVFLGLEFGGLIRNLVLEKEILQPEGHILGLLAEVLV